VSTAPATGETTSARRGRASAALAPRSRLGPRAARAARTRCRRRAKSRAGFTLLEMLAVVLLTGVVVTAAVDFYLDLSRETIAAAALTRDGRHAVAVLDRIARDLEGSTLVKKPEAVDPLDHPWLFLAEAGSGEDGADRLKLMTRSHVPRTDAPEESDLQVVCWFASPDATGRFALRRFATGQLPEGLDRSFPPDDEAVVVARDVARFAVRLLDENGEWKSAWDSSTLVDSSKLPLAAEIELAFAPPDGALESAALDAAPVPYVRRVILPVRPIDLEALLGQGEDGDAGPGDEQDEEEDAEAPRGAVTVSECLARSPALAAALAGVDPSVLASVAGQPAASVAASSGVPLPAECQ